MAEGVSGETLVGVELMCHEVNPGANTGLNNDAEILREYELMILSFNGDTEYKRQWYAASDDRAIIEIQQEKALNAWEDESL